MDYAKIAMCLIGMSLYFNAGKIEARGGGPDHAVLWAALSLLTSVAALGAGAGWLLWALAQVALLAGITLARVLLEKRRP